MFLWDEIGATHIHFDGADAAAPAVTALLDACTVPIVIHDYARAGILGTGTLLKCGARHVLLTAAHLFDSAATSGNWLIPERTTRQLLSLEGAQVHIIQGSDIALIDCARIAAWPRLVRGRIAIPARLALRAWLPVRRHRQRCATYCLAGYPAAWSCFQRGYLAAKRLTIATTTTTPQREDAGELRCIYGRTAERHDGQVIHTPALEGMSGAAIWEIGKVERRNGAATLHLAGVQSAFMHSRYLRGDMVGACESFLRR